MLSLALTLLAAVPHASDLAGSRALHGALVKVEAVQAAPPEGVPLAQLTREQLRAEYRRLEEDRPGIGGQITAIALGGACMFGGVLSLWVTLLLSIGGGLPTLPLVMGAVLLLGGGGLLTFGIVMLRMALNERKPFNEAMDEIQQRLDGSWDENHNGQPPSPPEPPYEPVVPPPPPPPPPGAESFPNVRPSLVLATF